MEQDTFVTVNVGDFGFARCGRGKSRVKGEYTFRTQRTDINNILTERAF